MQLSIRGCTTKRLVGNSRARLSLSSTRFHRRGAILDCCICAVLLLDTELTRLSPELLRPHRRLCGVLHRRTFSIRSTHAAAHRCNIFCACTCIIATHRKEWIYPYVIQRMQRVCSTSVTVQCASRRPPLCCCLPDVDSVCSAYAADWAVCLSGPRAGCGVAL